MSLKTGFAQIYSCCPKNLSGPPGPYAYVLTNVKDKRATRNGDINNHIAEHHLQTKHQIDWDSATCITYSTDYYQRLSKDGLLI